MTRNPKPQTLTHKLDTGRRLSITIEEQPSVTRLVFSWTPDGLMTPGEALAMQQWLHPILWRYEADGIPLRMEHLNSGMQCTATDHGMAVIRGEPEVQRA